MDYLLTMLYDVKSGFHLVIHWVVSEDVALTIRGPAGLVFCIKMGVVTSYGITTGLQQEW